MHHTTKPLRCPLMYLRITRHTVSYLIEGKEAVRLFSGSTQVLMVIILMKTLLRFLFYCEFVCSKMFSSSKPAKRRNIGVLPYCDMSHKRSYNLRTVFFFLGGGVFPSLDPIVISYKFCTKSHMLHYVYVYEDGA